MQSVKLNDELYEVICKHMNEVLVRMHGHRLPIVESGLNLDEHDLYLFDAMVYVHHR